jgi:hypothetical protein
VNLYAELGSAQGNAKVHARRGSGDCRAKHEVVGGEDAIDEGAPGPPGGPGDADADHALGSRFTIGSDRLRGR